MIVELRQIGGDSLYALTEQFRGKLKATELISLLDSNNPEIISIGAYILSEIDFGKYSSSEFVERLLELTNHEDSSIRYNAFAALYPALSANDEKSVNLIKMLSADPDQSISNIVSAVKERHFHQYDS